MRYFSVSVLAVIGFLSFALNTASIVQGASLPAATAVFETSLASPITSSASAMTLAANSVRGGDTLSGYSCFTIDEGSAQAEYVCGTVSGTTVSAMTRGVSPLTGTTTITALQFSHRRGANVKITDFPLVQILKAQANGQDTYPNILHYASHPTFTVTTDIVDKKYVDDTAFSGAGVIDATSLARGVVELATTLEAASSTANGSSGALAIPASSATSTYNAATAPLRVVVTQNSGKIDNNFIATSTLLGASSVGKNVQVFSSTGTSTFSVPSGVSYFTVEVQGAGGGGSGASNTGTGGGGGGGYSIEELNLSGTTTVQVFVGSGGAGGATSPTNGSDGTWSTFGSNGFYLSASGGLGGATTGTGGNAGVGSGGDLNIQGQGGGAGSSATSGVIGGTGGSSHLGGGAKGVRTGDTVQNGGNYGGGGGGAAIASGTAGGGTGAQGIVIVRW